MAIIGVAATLGEERRCLRALKKLNATSIKNAVKPIEISDIAGLSLGRVELALQKLIARGKVEKTEENKYYAKCENKKHC
jgi:DNA-binding IclR family transcriptional regulator